MIITQQRYYARGPILYETRTVKNRARSTHVDAVNYKCEQTVGVLPAINHRQAIVDIGLCETRWFFSAASKQRRRRYGSPYRWWYTIYTFYTTTFGGGSSW